MFGTILVADSGDGQSESMLKMLLEIPIVEERASVTLLNVIAPQLTPQGMEEKRSQGQEILDTAIERLKLPADRAKILLREGDPKSTVCDVADELNSDLIIMGSRGLQGLKAILGNSVSQYVFQLTTRPMLLVRDDVFVRRIQRIMVAVDKSKTSHESLDIALALLKDIPGGQLILAHVNAKELKGNADQDPALVEAINAARRAGIAYSCHSAYGKAGEEICRIVEETRADILMVGSPDRRPSIAKQFPDIDRLLGNSTSDYIRINANCPVLMSRLPE
jgi:nucleotide-binding universal stress UspA family protein